MANLRIMIADDHPVFLAGLKTVVDGEPDIEIVGQAADGEQAMKILEQEQPDLAILDIGMPKIDGVGLLTEINSRKMPIKVIFMTMYRERKLYDKGIELGLRGYVLKDSASSDLIEAIRTVAAGERFVSPDLLQHFIESKSKSGEIRATSENLSASEMRILSLIAEYKTSREIADALFISPRTVETHRTNICTKLGLQGRHALMKYALSLFEDRSS
jgi:DNA-binding NarL/FixJ family response regulator